MTAAADDPDSVLTAVSLMVKRISGALKAPVFFSRESRSFRDGEGIVSEDYEKTIRNIGCVGRDGMRSTDVTILNLMIS